MIKSDITPLIIIHKYEIYVIMMQSEPDQGFETLLAILKGNPLIYCNLRAGD